jgi:ABC-type nitrate/sulfonate/bicarbonate transport system substrate-binding protein
MFNGGFQYKLRLAGALWLAVAIVVAGCQVAAPAPKLQLTFMAGYKPQANLPFVGVYVAQERGFFEKEGLTVDIQHSGGGGDNLQLLAAGKVQVTTVDAAVLLQRRADPGLPLVSIALIGQTGQQAYIAMQASGIRTPADWAGRKIGYKGAPPPDLYAILDAAGVAPLQVELVSVGFDPHVLTTGMVDVYPVFKSNEPDTLAREGHVVTAWQAADFGVPSLGLTYASTPEQIAAKSVELAAFTRAALAGIKYASTHVDEAVDMVMKYAPEADRAHMRYMLETELAAGRPADGAGFGVQSAEQWSALHDMLLKYKALAIAVEIDQVFTTQFLAGK